MIKILVPSPFRKEGTPITMEVGKNGFKRTEVVNKYNIIDGKYFYVDNETTYLIMGVGLTSIRQKIENFRNF